MGESRRLLVIGAHPDDAESGAGGSVALWSKAGDEVQLIVCTSGDKGTKDPDLSPHRLAELREQEQEEAARCLGISRVIFLRHQDGQLEPTLKFRGELALLIRQVRPDVVVTHDPWRPYMLHPDHRAVGFTATDAIVAARDHLFHPEYLVSGISPHAPKEIYYFHTGSADLFTDISEVLERKLEALRCHRTQLAHVVGWEDRMRKRAAEMGRQAGVAYAEGFKRVVLR
ncbi:MAG: PIG-L family deacetylase [Deltaproteobacteria bacterium]|nr:PIG-L family deacetylase [Deltaproteobacteria bacterium]MBI3078453.1 PIG-L family deacetylase [Deltaproteobacteria bacterium]